MTIKEMHIELNMSLQKIAANLTRKFLPEEYDWVLNKMVTRFIQTNLKMDHKERVAVDQLNLDGIAHLVTPVELETVVVNDRKVKAVLPGNYMHLLSDESVIIKECNAPATLDHYTSTSHTYSIIGLTESSLGSAPYSATASMTIESYTITLPTDLPIPSAYTGYNSKRLDELVAYYKTFFASNGIDLYWEYCDGLYRPGCFIYRGSIATLAYTIDGVTTNSLTTVMVSENVANRNATYEEYRENRLTASALIPSLQRDPFYKSSFESPISELVGDRLYIYKDSSFRISAVAINYVRKPRRMSLSLSVNCEVAEPFHQTICDMAVEYIKGRMENGQGQQLITQDLETRVIL